MLLGYSVPVDKRNSSEVCAYLKLLGNLGLLPGPSLEKGIMCVAEEHTCCCNAAWKWLSAVCQASIYSPLPPIPHTKFSVRHRNWIKLRYSTSALLFTAFCCFSLKMKKVLKTTFWKHIVYNPSANNKVTSNICSRTFHVFQVNSRIRRYRYFYLFFRIEYFLYSSSN